MGEFEPQSQSPFGGFLQGATRGAGLTLAIQNQKRAIEEERRKRLLEVVKLRNEMGSAADAVIQEMDPNMQADILKMFPTQGAEQRGMITPKTFAEFGVSGVTSPQSASNTTALAQMEKARAASSKANNDLQDILNGKTKTFIEEAKVATENILSLRNKIFNPYTPEESKAELRFTLSVEESKLKEAQDKARVAAGVQNSRGQAIGRFAVPGGQPAAGNIPQKPNRFRDLLGGSTVPIGLPASVGVVPQ